MMLTTMDDSLWHQLPTTFDHVATSDPRFFDRYWFAVYDKSGTTAIQVTMGVYRNMNVLDAGVAVVHRGVQHNLRTSRSLGPEILPSCGPVHVEVVEPLRLIRLRISEGGHGYHGEITWQATAEAREEQPHFA